MNWQKTRLGNIITTKKGFAFKSAKYVDSGVPIVRVSDFTSDSISEGDLKYYPKEEAQNYLDYELHYKDIIIQTVGSWPNNPASVVGKVVRVPYILDKSLLNQNAVKIVPKNNIDNDFLYYRLKSRDFDGHVIGQARGAANQASITLETIRSFKMSIPDYSEQIRLGKILTQYDDLIANNNKRIKILEQMAENLYKEWFVRFRFPGYETAEFVDGVPKGWGIKRLSDVAIIVMGQSPSSCYYNNDMRGLPFHQGVGSYGNRYLQDDVYSTEGKRIAETNSIIFSVRAPVGRLNITLNKIILGRGVASINENKGRNLFLYYLLNSKFSKEDLIGGGTIFSSVTKDELYKQKLLMPEDGVCNKFNEMVELIEKEIINIHTQNQNLTKQRDYLLPRLMSGKLQVK